jgi:hypothetical protein
MEIYHKGGHTIQVIPFKGRSFEMRFLTHLVEADWCFLLKPLGFLQEMFQVAKEVVAVFA